MKNKKVKKYNHFNLLVLFVIFVSLTLIISSIIKIISSVKESKFQGDYFNLIVKNKNYYIININKITNTVSVVEVKNNTDSSMDKNKLGLNFSIPINAMIVYKNESGFKDIKDFFNFRTAYFMFLQTSGYTLVGMNKVDVLKVYLGGAFVSSDNYKVKLYGSVLGETNENLPGINNDIYELFKDNNIINEEVSIQVVNSSGIDGMGSRVASMLRNIGFNVVSVITDDEKRMSKIISLYKDNYTIKSLAGFFKIPIEYTDEISVADINIIIGKDFVK